MRKYLLDLAERAAATYVETFLGLLLAGGLVDVTAARAAAIAAVPAGLSVLKSALARFTGPSASLLPGSDTPARR